MTSALDFMLAARRSEMQGLQALSLTCALVVQISRLVHALQRERGYSNFCLGGQAASHAHTLAELSQQALEQERVVRAALGQISASASADKAQLFTRIAYALHALDALPALRRRVRDESVSAAEAMRQFSRLVAALLAVVFEAADTAVDPRVTRALVALFNFMQGKELAGQERATGVAGFMAGYFDQALQDRLHFLQDGQKRCFDSFVASADDAARTEWEQLCKAELVEQIERLRQVAVRTTSTQRVQGELGDLWFDLTSERMDTMKLIEDHLADSLQQLCAHKTCKAQADLDNQRRLLRQLDQLDRYDEQGAPRLYNVQATELQVLPGEAPGGEVNRSLLQALHEQTVRLQQLQDELEQARETLSERRLVERAKGLLMSRHGLSEESAYRTLQSAAMERGQRLGEVAQTVLNYSDLLKQ
ncbi:nitrate regulatory protein [Halopseudomonas maritima]|uniref:nitrate regulatory protein n=1 Tax=Halopseudomonas maritima TaxID=2918528 RepID=UPI001EEC82B1|nr:nitrate regulatory protein [Halopseudomonas maritima]UJJ31408.1 nitrate- and nitrite sensing domain-containing protein [Halopseudomonas maritima]